MKNNKIGSFLAGISGAAIGTAIAVAGTLALKNNKTKAKVKNILKDTKSDLKVKSSALSN